MHDKITYGSILNISIFDSLYVVTLKTINFIFVYVDFFISPSKIQGKLQGIKYILNFLV